MPIADRSSDPLVTVGDDVFIHPAGRLQPVTEPITEQVTELTAIKGSDLAALIPGLVTDVTGLGDDSDELELCS